MTNVLNRSGLKIDMVLAGGALTKAHPDVNIMQNYRILRRDSAVRCAGVVQW